MIHNYRWRLGLAEGEPKLDDLEKQPRRRVRSSRVPTITLEGDANGAHRILIPLASTPRSSPASTRTGSMTGGIGHNLPQEAPQAFAEAIVDADRL